MEGSGKCSAVPPAAVAFHAAARTWVLGELAAGHIAVLDIKNGLPATRALLGAPISSFPKHEGPPPRLVPAAAPKDLSDDFGRLLHENGSDPREPTIPLLIRLVLDLKLTVDRSDKARPKWVIDHRTEPK